MLAEAHEVDAELRAPTVRLLDAGALHLDERQLREAARELSRTSGWVFVARSYCFPYALVVGHSGPVGVDVERVGHCDDAFADLICSGDERRDAERAADFDAHVTSLWCSKEALAKGLGDAVRYEPSRLVSPLSWPNGRAGVWISKQIDVDREHVAWLCWRDGATSIDSSDLSA
jgi:hypothetical protein